jgi:hypothetical protein
MQRRSQGGRRESAETAAEVMSAFNHLPRYLPASRPAAND